MKIKTIVSIVLVLMISRLSESAMTFDGLNTYVLISSNPSLEPTAGLSLCVWIKRTLPGTLTEQDFFNDWYDQDGAYHGYLFTVWASDGGVLSDRIRFFIGNGTNTYGGRPIFSSPITDTSWHFIVATWDGSTEIIYLDGVLDPGSVNGEGSAVAFVSVSGIDYSGAQLGRLGDVSSGGNEAYYFNGSLDDARVYGRALSAQEIQTLYASRSRLNMTYSLGGYWRLDDGVDGTSAPLTKPIRDFSGNGNIGTPISDPLWAASTFLKYP